MKEIFNQVKFKDLDVNEPFFDSLKNDYPEFKNWFKRKQLNGTSTNVLKIDNQIAAFIYLKDGEIEPIELTESVLPAVSRVKIGTLKINDEIKGKRLGEGAIGIALWNWFRVNSDEIYVTVYKKHASLISLLKKFGFKIAGIKKDTGEYVLIKSKLALDYSNPYLSFPYIDPNFDHAGLIVVNDDYHDRLFPYSTLQNTKQYKTNIVSDVAGNGITKMYVSGAYSGGYDIGEPVLIYRKSTESSQHGYKSAITSLATIANKFIVKSNWKQHMSRSDILSKLGNKTILTDEELTKYLGKKEMRIYQLVYNYPFGAGNNINWQYLKNNGYWGDSTHKYPTEFSYSNEQIRTLVCEKEHGIIDIIKNFQE